MRKEKHRKTESNQIEKSDKRTGIPDRNLQEGSQNHKNQIENNGGWPYIALALDVWYASSPIGRVKHQT
jgi:hypothetical protein